MKCGPTLVIAAVAPVLALGARCLRMGVKITPPFTMVDGDEPTLPAILMTAPYNGFAMQYWAEQLAPAIAQEVSNEQETSGVSLEDPIDFSCLNITEYITVTEMLRGAGLGEVDVSHTAITMTSAREASFNLDFSHSWFVSGFRVLAREQANLLSASFALFGTLGQAIGLYLGTILVCALAGGLMLVPLEECRRGPVRAWPEHGSEWKKFETAASITLLALFGSDAVEPEGPFVKPALIVFKVLGPLLTIVVTALVTVFMLQETPAAQVNSFDDLRGHTVNVPQGSTAEQYLRRNGIGLTVAPYQTVDETLDAFGRGKGDAVVFDFPILEYYANRNGAGSYAVVGPVFEEQKYGIAVGPGAPSWLKEIMNRALLRTWKTEEYNDMELQWFGDQDGTGGTGATANNASRQLIVVLICAFGLLAVAILVRLGTHVHRCVYGLGTIYIDDPEKNSIRRSRTRLANIVSEQEAYGYALPPAATTRATWELTWAISDYLRHGQATGLSMRGIALGASATIADEPGASEGGPPDLELGGDAGAGPTKPLLSKTGSKSRIGIGRQMLKEASGDLSLRQRNRGQHGERKSATQMSGVEEEVVILATRSDHQAGIDDDRNMSRDQQQGGSALHGHLSGGRQGGPPMQAWQVFDQLPGSPQLEDVEDLPSDSHNLPR